MKKILALIITAYCSLMLSAQELERKFDEILTVYAASKNFNGVALVAKNGKVLFHKGYGYLDAKAALQHDGKGIFQIGSLTKQITAALILQLHQEGKLSLNEPLSKYFTGFANGDSITIQHLLTHTSGIYNYTNDTSIMKSDVTRPRTKDELIKLFATYKPDFQPGQRFNYSNSGYSLLGYIISKVENKPYEQVVRERIFNPLGMTRSGFDFTNLVSKDKAVGYFSVNGNNKAPIVDSTIAYSAGAIYSTAEDMLKWERGLAAGKVITTESSKAMFTPFKAKYGYGWSIDTAFATNFNAHSGGIHGFSSYIMRFPAEELVIILLDNGSSASLGKIARAVSAAAFNKPYTLPVIPKEISLSTEILKQYIGEYQLAPTFSITVRLEGNQLKAQATGQQEFEVYPEKENVFFLKVVDAKMEFVKDAEGKVTELILHQNGLSPRGKKIK